MKDIKTFVIGFLTCACMLLIMGASPFASALTLKNLNTNKIGRYQIESTGDMLDTATGELYKQIYGEDEKLGWVSKVQFIK